MFRFSITHTPLRHICLLGLLVMTAVPVNVMADTIITPYLGYRGGGDVEDVITGSTVDIDESDTQGLIVGWEQGNGVFEIIYSRQATALTAGSTVSSDTLVDVDVTQLLGSGRTILNPDLGSYVGFMVGVVHFDFDGSEFDADTRFAIGFDGGIDYPLTEHLGLRAGLRGVFAFVDTEDGAFCQTSASCPIEVSDSILQQWEVFTGLSIRF